MNDQKFKSCHYSLEEDKILFLNDQVSIFGVKSLHPDLIDTCTVIFERNITESLRQQRKPLYKNVTITMREHVQEHQVQLIH
jgi:hypothetical protein